MLLFLKLRSCHLQLLRADAEFIFELSLSSTATFSTVTVQCKAARPLLSEYVPDFVRVSKLFPRHSRELALIGLSTERLIC